MRARDWAELAGWSLWIAAAAGYLLTAWWIR
jgi:hypothetical protein